MKVGTFEQAMNDYKNGVYDFTKNGKCSCCGNCCSNLLPMSDKEINTIKKYIKVNGIKEQKHIVPFAEPSFDMTCPFLNSGAKEKCTIYEVRPLICREFSCNKELRPKETRMNAVEHIPRLVRETFFGK